LRNKEVLQIVKEKKNILYTVDRRKDNWIGHMLRRNCLLKHVIEGNIKETIEVTGRRGRKSKQLMDGLMEERGYWILKEEALDRTLWRTCFGRGYGPVSRQTTE
jgi:hypothetical protein